MSRYFLVPLVLSISGGAALAVCPSPVVIRNPVISSSYYYPSYAPTYYTPIVKKVVEPVIIKKVYTPIAVYAPVIVPFYGASYVPPAVMPAPAAPTPATPTAATNGIAEVLVELRKMNARIDALEKKTTKPSDPFNPAPLIKPGATATPRDGMLSLVTAKCAACHDSASSATKGGGLTLVDKGTLVKLTDKQARKLMTTAYNGKMPPKSSGITALTDEEVSVIVNHLDK